MKTTTKIWILLFVLLIAGGTVAAEFIPVHELTTRVTQHTTNAGELTHDTLVGQTFVSQRDELSGIGVMFATFSGRENTRPVEFHLRESLEAREDLRTGVVNPEQLGDNQFYRFEFEPLSGVKDKTFFFYVVSPESVPGNAVTVDLNTQDPYHLGSAFLVREAGNNVTDPARLASAGKPTVDVVFETYHTVSLRAHIFYEAQQAYRTFVGTWDERQSMYAIWGRAAAMAALWLVVLWMIRGSLYPALESKFGISYTALILLGLFFVGAMTFRVIYGSELPVTNDEGNYLYDARILREGKLAGGDGYVKAPLVIVWIAAWQLFGGDTILAGRLSSIFVSALTLVPLYFIGREMLGRKAGLMAAATWAFLGAPTVFGIYVHTQPLAIFFGVSAVAVLYMALQGSTPKLTFFARQPKPSSAPWFFLAGVLFGLGVASRKSILALGLIPILLIICEGTTWKKRVRHLAMVGFGFLVTTGLFLGLATLLYGPQGFWEALGVNSAEDGISAVTPEEVENVRAYSLRGMTPFFREALPLILLALIGLGATLERALRESVRGLARYTTGVLLFAFNHIIPKLAWAFPLIVFAWAYRFFFEYEGSAFHMLGIPWLWYLMGAILVLFALLPRREEEKLLGATAPVPVPKTTQPVFAGNQMPKVTDPKSKAAWWHEWAVALLAPLWVLGLIVFYTNWIKFHANYIAEFLPPLALLASIGALAAYQRLKGSLFLSVDYPPLEVVRKLTVLAVTVVIVWALYVSNFITFFYEHTGTFSQGAAKEAAAWARQNIPPDKPIFTGAALIPYLSGHHVALDIAHPRWYAYEFTRKDPERLNVFLPPAEEMVQAYRDAEWFLLESQTGFSFLMEYSEIEAGLEKDWQAVKGIENGGNTLTFYRRIR